MCVCVCLYISNSHNFMVRGHHNTGNSELKDWGLPRDRRETIVPVPILTLGYYGLWTDSLTFLHVLSLPQRMPCLCHLCSQGGMKRNGLEKEGRSENRPQVRRYRLCPVRPHSFPLCHFRDQKENRKKRKLSLLLCLSMERNKQESVLRLLPE